MTRSLYRWPLAAVCVLAACHYSNPHGSQALPPTTRLTTDPPGAKVYVPELNVEYETPCDLPESVDEDTEIVIRKDGYAGFTGRLGELKQVALGTYALELAKK